MEEEATKAVAEAVAVAEIGPPSFLNTRVDSDRSTDPCQQPESIVAVCDEVITSTWIVHSILEIYTYSLRTCI